MWWILLVLLAATNNRVRLNVFTGGNGSLPPTFSTGATSNTFGVGLVGTSKDNLIEKNKIGGNLNGVCMDSMASTQEEHHSPQYHCGVILSVHGSRMRFWCIGRRRHSRIILDPRRKNTLRTIRCLTYMELHGNPRLVQEISKPDNDEDRQGFGYIGAFGRNRSSRFPGLGLINAVFHPSGRPLSKAAKFRSQSGQTSDSIPSL